MSPVAKEDMSTVAESDFSFAAGDMSPAATGDISLVTLGEVSPAAAGDMPPVATRDIKQEGGHVEFTFSNIFDISRTFSDLSQECSQEVQGSSKGVPATF